MKTRLLILISFLILALMNSNVVMARKIYGYTLSSSDSIPLQGMSCKISSDNLTSDSTYTDNKGHFNLSDTNGNDIELEISSIHTCPLIINIPSGRNDIDLEEIYIDKATTLDDFTVSAKSLLYSGGKTIAIPSESEVAASNSSIELLQKIPLEGLRANPITRSIEVDGSTPIILINGIPSSLESLRTIRPQDIIKIEYSRATPARYADSGKSGLINIFLKERKDGGYISFWGRSAINTAFLDASVSGKYNFKRSQIAVLYTPSWRKYDKSYATTHNEYLSKDFNVSLDEHSVSPFYYITNNLELRYDLLYNSANLFSATFSMEPFKSKRDINANAFDSILGSYKLTDINRQNYINPSLDLFYRHEFSASDAMEVEMTGTFRSEEVSSLPKYTYSEDYFKQYPVNTKSKRKSLISEFSYSHSFPFNSSLYLGIQNTISDNHNHYLLTDYTPFLSENNNFIYASFQHNIKNIWYTIYTGAKLFWTKNDLNKRHFIKNITSAQISWKINSKWDVKGFYSFKPLIPNLSQLTDYPQQTSPYLISNGNANLKTSTCSNFQLSGSFSPEPFSLSLTASSISWNNPTFLATKFINGNTFLISPQNFRSAHALYTYLNIGVNNFYGFGTNIQCCLGYTKTSDVEWMHSLTYFSADINLWWNHGPFTITYWRKIPGKYLDGQTIYKEENGDMLSFTYKPNSRLSIEAGWWYMFENKGTKYFSQDLSAISPGFQRSNIKNNANMFVLTLTYTDDFGRNFDTSKRTLQNKDTGSAIYLK